MFMSSHFLWGLALLCHTSSAASISTNTSCLPVVDLGYTIHQAISYNSTAGNYKFSNIRFAQAPTGDLRFRAPLPPLIDRSVVQNGQEYRACPQAIPRWQANAYIPIGKYSGLAPFTMESWKQDIANSNPPPGLLETMNDNTSEDCLFLDVHVPKKVFKKAGSGKGVPVLAWIHGGGFAFGSKSGHPTPYMNPDGIIFEAQKINDEGLVFVAINYRLGALGFLASPEVEADGALNAGLLDQRLALEWIQENIHLFGGDPDRVTLLGESGGGGAALYHMAAYGGHDGQSPFSQVIAQSPVLAPRGVARNGSYSGFLETLGVSSLAQARQASERDIIRANEAQIGAAPPTTYIHSVVTDGLIIPGESADMFNNGQFDHHVKVLAAYNSFEGAFFYDPAITTEAGFRSWIGRSITGLSSRDIEELANEIYPPIFDGSLGYDDQATRQMVLYSEGTIDCSFLLINQALNGTSFACE
ncbi:Alpha/Beta hydrolase protein [Stachybotrys elegans]|uniref:Carboxylic ester hydrolase n=1 Tax=Stachybotrys elegans TaxID=80388 RepID=A0A8K0SV90_9HYPO|nr:Alpha/Beta hydrolase protein [Stachybotrys elegans]